MQNDPLVQQLAIEELARRGAITLYRYHLFRVNSGWIPDCLIYLNEKIIELAKANIASPEDLTELEGSIQRYLLFSFSLNNKLRYNLIRAEISSSEKLELLKGSDEVSCIFHPKAISNEFDALHALFDEDHRIIQTLITAENYSLADMAERNNAYRFIEYCISKFEYKIKRKEEAQNSASRTIKCHQKTKEIITSISKEIWEYQVSSHSEIITKGQMADTLIQTIEQLKEMSEWPQSNLSQSEKNKKLNKLKRLSLPSKETIQRSWLSHAPSEASKRGRPPKKNKCNVIANDKEKISEKIINML